MQDEGMHWRRALREARQMVANHGWRAAAATARGRLRGRLRGYRAQAAADSTLWQPTDTHSFDREHGVDTSGLIRGEALATGSRNDRWNTAYYGIGVSVFHRVMEQVPARFREGATFIDLGCGKGRALLLASGYPFRKVVGVEIVPSLHGIALENARLFLSAHPEAPPIHVLLGDAAGYVFPSGPVLLYLYHPFCRPVLEQVLKNLRESLDREPRPVAVVYINDELRDALDRARFLERIWTATVAMDAMDCLADRVGSSAEDCAVYLSR
jgi:SAM-dependent methyltransferase